MGLSLFFKPESSSSLGMALVVSSNTPLVLLDESLVRLAARQRSEFVQNFARLGMRQVELGGSGEASTLASRPVSSKALETEAGRWANAWATSSAPLRRKRGRQGEGEMGRRSDRNVRCVHAAFCEVG